MKEKYKAKFKLAASVMTEKGIIKRRDLLQTGLRDNDLVMMKKMGLIGATEQRGEYIIRDMNALSTCAEELFDLGEIDRACLCYKKCFESDPQNSHYAKSALLADCRKKDYENLERYLDVLIGQSNIEEQKKLDLFLDMFSRLCVLPKKYICLIQKYDDTLAQKEEIRDPENANFNAFLEAFHTQDYYSAAIFVDKMYKETPTIDTLLIKTLVYRLQEHNTKFLKNVIQCTRNRAFDQTLLILQREETYHELKTSMVLLEMILKDIIEMKTSGVPLKPQPCPSEKLLDLVQYHQYDEILKRHLIYLKTQFINPHDNALAIALEEVISIRDNLLEKEEQQVLANKDIEIPYSEDNDPLTNMLDSLMKGENAKANNYLIAFLNVNGLTRYKYLVSGLIQICQLEGDTGFVKPMNTIYLITKGNFKVDTANYIDCIHYRIEHDAIETAKIYLQLLTQATQNGDTDVELSQLSETLITLKNRIEWNEFIATKKGKEKILKPTPKLTD